ncbi:MAG: phosphatidylglycerophosphatase A [Rhodospirillaceae bacterium]|nr:phosphatidylglycerophosphatase A [Rhodospirillaceae bacterium]
MATIPTGVRLIATFFGAGTFPAASGTFGSVVALPFAIAMLQLPAPYGRLVLLCAVTFVLLLGVWASGRYCAAEGSTDPGVIVIDEVAGQWLALIFAAPGNPWHFFAGFMLFRFFDIAKVWPANWAQDHLPGGWGVMMDDIVAGLWAAGFLYAGIYVANLPDVAPYLRHFS